MVHFTRKEHYNLDDFRQVVRFSATPGGCPWDQEQTHASIRRNLLEEAYEAAGGHRHGEPGSAPGGTWGRADAGPVPRQH